MKSNMGSALQGMVKEQMKKQDPDKVKIQKDKMKKAILEKFKGAIIK